MTHDALIGGLVTFLCTQVCFWAGYVLGRSREREERRRDWKGERQCAPAIWT